ncbi:MutS protein msh4 [Exserohilum turcicum]
MGERAGVLNLHLAVEIGNEHSMTMLYKATQGVAKEAHYGLKLARVVPLPPGLVEHATAIARKVERHALQNKKASETVLKEKRRKLILNLKEHLIQAYNGVLEGEVLTAWLKELQKEFVNRMVTLEAEAENAINETEEDQDEEMGDGSTCEEERSRTNDSQSSIMSIDSHITSTESESTFRAMSEASTVRAVSENEC